MAWEGDKPENETRAAIEAGETVYSHGGTFHAHLGGEGRVWVDCTIDGCEGCADHFTSVDEYYEWLNGT